MRRLVTTLYILCATIIAVSAETTVSWLTASPGVDVYQLEGHAALRIKNDSVDMVINWGVFDFATDAFVWRFALGETDYLCEASPYPPFAEWYRRQGRSLTEQVLEMDSVQVARLIALVDSTLTPQCRSYRYNYVLDNCATRPFDYIERALGEPVGLPEVNTADATFRSEMKRYHKDYPWYQFGIDLALGSGIDYPITVRERGFSPIEMQTLLAMSTIADSAGLQIPFVKQTLTQPIDPMVTVMNPYPNMPTPMTCAIVLLLLILCSVYRDQQRGKLTRWVDCALFSLQGLAGCLITFLIFVSTHYATSPNWVVLWLNPVAFAVVIGVWIGRQPCGWLALYHLLNLLALGALTIIFIAEVQGCNMAFIPLMLCSALRSANYLLLWRRKRAKA